MVAGLFAKVSCLSITFKASNKYDALGFAIKGQVSVTYFNTGCTIFCKKSKQNGYIKQKQFILYTENWACMNNLLPFKLILVFQKKKRKEKKKVCATTSFEGIYPVDS